MGAHRSGAARVPRPATAREPRRTRDRALAVAQLAALRGPQSPPLYRNNRETESLL